MKFKNPRGSFFARALSKGWGLVLVIAALALPVQAKKIEVKVLARVAGHVVTDRQVLVDNLIENPALYERGAPPLAATRGDLEQGLQRVITQLMVFEESRIFGSDRVSNAEIDQELASLKKSFGERWSHFLKDFDLSQDEVKERLLHKTLLREALATRLKAAREQLRPSEGAAGSGDGAGKPSPGAALAMNPENVIEEWLKQLRARYRVQMFRFENQ